MAYNHEIIHIEDGLPIKIFDFHALDLDRYIPKHWHRSVELLFCQIGSLNVWLGSKLYVMKKGDIVVINSNVVHATQSLENNHILVIQFPFEFLRHVTMDRYYTKIQFDINTVVQTQSDYHSIQEELDKLFDLLHNRVMSETDLITVNLRKMEIVYSVLTTLFQSHCEQLTNDNLLKDQSKNLKKLSEIITYIGKNYTENITLVSVSLKFNYSTNYFSRFFRKYMGMSFTQYLRSIGLDDSYDKFMNNSEDISTISLTSGFGNYRNLYNAFYETYHVASSQYKKIRQQKL